MKISVRHATASSETRGLRRGSRDQRPLLTAFHGPTKDPRRLELVAVTRHVVIRVSPHAIDEENVPRLRCIQQRKAASAAANSRCTDQQ
jgi:hypothetical protein